jgi:hypothetical protein
MFICRSLHQPGKSLLTPRNTFSDLVTKGMFTHHTYIVKCGIWIPVSWISPETRASIRMKETERDLIIMKCDDGEYRVCIWAFTGESLSFFIRYLSALKRRLLFDSLCGYFLCTYNASALTSSWRDEYFIVNKNENWGEVLVVRSEEMLRPGH